MGNTANVSANRRVADALAGDLTHGPTRTLHSGRAARPLLDDRALRAVRDQSEDGLQVARSLRGGRARGARRSEPGAPPLPASDPAPDRSVVGGRAPGASELGAAQAARLAHAAAPRARVAGDQHRRGSPGAPRAGKEASPASAPHPSWGGA